jgi:hypothetical protein
MEVKFVLFEDGYEKILLPNPLLTIPGTGDIIDDPVPGGAKYRVKSVTHQNVFNSPGEHTVIVTLENL